MPGSPTTPGRPSARVGALGHVAFHYTDSVSTRNQFSIAAQWLACTFPYRRFADILADACARLGADVGRYSFIAVDLHHLLLAGLPAHLCENAQEPTRRRIIFSIALFPTAATALFSLDLTKSRRTFYAQIERLCFPTASTLSSRLLAVTAMQELSERHRRSSRLTRRLGEGNALTQGVDSPYNNAPAAKGEPPPLVEAALVCLYHRTLDSSRR